MILFFCSAKIVLNKFSISLKTKSNFWFLLSKIWSGFPKSLIKLLSLSLLIFILLKNELLSLSSNSPILPLRSSLTGTDFSAAPVGVGALKSDTKSINVVSVS